MDKVDELQNRIAALEIENAELKASAKKWLEYHDAAAEDAKKWRKDAQNAQGYYGHENGCDCAVCDDIAQRESLRNIADGEFNKLLDDNARLIDTVERYRIALEIIVNIGSNDPAFRFVNVANEALGFARKNL